MKNAKEERRCCEGRSLRGKLASCIRTPENKRSRKGKRIVKQICWADEIGGELLKIHGSNEGEDRVLGTSGKSHTQVHKEGVTAVVQQRSKSGGGCIIKEGDERGLPLKGKSSSQGTKVGFTANHQESKLRGANDGHQAVVKSRGEGGHIKGTNLSRGSFKEVLLRKITPQHRVPIHHLHHTPLPRAQGKPVRRCFRCLASDHLVAECRDPLRCLHCRRSGHRARSCKDNPRAGADIMNRAGGNRDRPPRAKVYVPYTEEYVRRVEIRRNAILADVIRPANLGPDPIATIKAALASRFGGYNDDFAVARCRERDFAIFLPEWVPAAVLARREILTLNGF